MDDYSELKTPESEKFMISLSDHGYLSFNFVKYFRQELKTFVVKVDEKLLDDFFDPSFDFSKIDYLNVTRLIKKEKAGSRLVYFLDDITNASD